MVVSLNQAGRLPIPAVIWKLKEILMCLVGRLIIPHSSYLKALYSIQDIKYNDNAQEQFYAEQIVNNSKIALEKYRYFSYGIWMTVAAVITPIIAFIIYKIINKD